MTGGPTTYIKNKNHLLPIEILEEIFKFLDYSDLKSCVEVCSTWCEAGFPFLARIAKEKCEGLFKSTCNEAFSRAKLSWPDLYESIRRWRCIDAASVSRVYYTSRLDNRYMEKPIQVQYLKDGVISYPRLKEASTKSDIDFNTITYYDSENLQVIDELTYDFTFTNYEENDDIIVFSDNELVLRIITKVNKTPHVLPNKLHEFSKFFFIKRVNEVFYVNKNDQIIMVSYQNENGEPTIKSEELIVFWFMADQIVALSFTEDEGVVKILTSDGTIYAVINKTRQIITELDKNCYRVEYVINELKEHGFEWTETYVYKWLTYVCDDSDDEDYYYGDYCCFFISPLQRKHARFYQYNNVVFVGTLRRRLLIYYNPYKTEKYYESSYSDDEDYKRKEKKPQLDLNHRPNIRIYLNPLCPVNLEPKELINKNQNGVTDVGVIEIQNGHRLVIVYFQRILIIELTHDQLKRSTDKVHKKCMVVIKPVK